jgi:ubiquinone biosynthesis protein COQ4
MSPRYARHFERSMRTSYFSGVKGLVALARDPNHIQSIFVIVDAFRKLGGLDARVLARLRSDPDTAALIRERYLPERADFDALARLPEGTLGHAFAKHMYDRNLARDFYPTPIGSDDGSYVSLRMRQTHDVWHVVTGFDTDIPGELGLQAFMLAQIQTPLALVTIGLMTLRKLKGGAGIDTMFDHIARGWQMGRQAKPFFAQKWESGWSRPLAEWRDELRV